MENHEKYMRRCIDLALMGEGNVAPNPMVGAVIVLEGKIVGEGYHQKYGEAHAEVNAINSVKDKSILSKCTIYVSLEPCAHFGKTPPCSDLIIENKIPHVVIGSLDTFSAVNGKGIEKLKKSGIHVENGILNEACRELNKRFYTFHEKKRPYVILKWAQTKDGFIDKIRKGNELGVNWISAPETRSLVHLWRSQEMGILIGRKTAQIDQPKLDVRDVVGINPVRIILDAQMKLPKSQLSSNKETKTIVLNLLKSKVDDEIQWIKLADMSINTILSALFTCSISSVLVEGGTETLQKFIDAETFDEVRIIEGDVFFKEGVLAPKINAKIVSSQRMGRDIIHNCSV